MTQQDDRRKALISRLAELASNPEAEPALAKHLAVTSAMVRKDLAALAAGQIPAGDAEVSPQATTLACRIRAAKTDPEIDGIMGDLAALLLEQLVPVPEGKAAQMVLMGRRHFLSTIEAAKAAALAATKGGRQIRVTQGAPAPAMPPAQLMGTDS